jgi:alanine racemase
LRLSIDGQALVANWRWLQGQGGTAACGAAIKADGYGVGARAVLDCLADAGCRDFFVATWAEAAALGAVDRALSLSVLHGVRDEDLPMALSGLAIPVLNSPAQIARWRESGGGACHVMIDTGMNRLGLTPEEARSGLLDGLAIDTLMSHLACADDPDHAMNAQQLFTFRMLKAMIPARRYSLANSAGICLGRRYAFSMTRPGLALYGGEPAPGAAVAIRQVVRIAAQVVQRREVPAGASVGYGATFVATSAMPVIILNIGYADGFFRAFSNGGSTEAGAVVGRVSMDLIAVDARASDAQEGDWIEIAFDLPSASATSGMSQYELLTTLGHRYQRRWT